MHGWHPACRLYKSPFASSAYDLDPGSALNNQGIDARTLVPNPAFRVDVHGDLRPPLDPWDPGIDELP